MSDPLAPDETPIVVASTDDASQDYMTHAQAQSADAAIQQFMARVRSRAKPEKPGGGDGATPVPQGGRAPVQITVRPRTVVEAIGAGAGAVASDVGAGFMETPSAIAGGMNDAVRNSVGGFARGLDGLADWLNTNVADLKIDVPATGSETLDRIIANPLTAAADALPEKLPGQKSVTGSMIREGARFLTGFVPVLRMMRAGGVKGPIAGPMTAGGISDFVTQDPASDNLSNLIQSVPALQNPVSEFLATDPDSPEALNRLRHSIEGLGFGVLAEGLTHGIRAAAHGRRAASEMQVQRQRHGEAQADQVGRLGDPSPEAPRVTVEDIDLGVPSDVAAKGVAGSARDAKQKGFAPPDLNFKVNWARIGGPDDINAVLGDMVTAFQGRVNEARRGVITREAASQLADNLGMTVDDLLARHRGQAFNAEQLIAAGRLFKASGEKVLELAQQAAGPGASAIDQANFRRMIATHAAIQERFLGASAEAGRALNAMKQVYQGGGVEQARQIQLFLDSMGGSEATTELARRVATLAGQNVPPGALATVIRRGWAATSRDMIQEAYVLGLLWNPTTHIANSASNLAVAFQQVYERGVAAKIGDFLGSSVDARVADGEAIAMAYGMLSSLKEAFGLSWRALKTGEAASPGAKLDIPREPAISAGTVSRELGHSAADAQAFASSAMGRAVDYAGAVTRAPGRLLLSGDEFFKTIGYRAEVHAQSLRQATQEGRSGPDLWRRMAEIANDPPEHIRLAAADAALYATFQAKPGEWAQAVMSLRGSGSMNPTFLVLPFVKTPANILRYSFERSPLAPLVGQWRDDIAAGGARRDLAMARMATGTAILSVAMDLASSGQITGAGPSDPGKREALMRQGWQPNSIKVGDKYYSYNRSEMSMLLSFAGTVAEKLKSKDLSPEDFDAVEENIAHAIATISQSVVSKTFFTGVSRLFQTIQGSERGEGGVATFLDQQTGSLMPFSSMFGFTERIGDPVQREVNSPWQAIQARVVGLSDSLPPARDLWGAERKPAEVYGRAYDLMSPVQVNQRKDSPIDGEIERLNMGLRRITKKGTFAGVEVNFREFPEVYDEYVRLAGNELKHPAWGLGAKDFLDAVIAGKHSMSSVYHGGIYSEGPEGGKASFIRNTVSDYRKLAQQQIISEAPARFPEFAAYIAKKQLERQQIKLPPGTSPMTLQ